jgi:hypothetical protein
MDKANETGRDSNVFEINPLFYFISLYAGAILALISH